MEVTKIPKKRIHMIEPRPCLKNKSCTNRYDLVNY